ncbi:hypothetical protein J8F10_21515 [Gemmata sp. G18]|uniref:Uncharacterized protein n=1 Tax=Gemmata palustris TaxID=2822762 RepID=A0ABS5BVZ1_9BACT|nr:hypothetical protein [Gemmata palustris]MBP3957840.1 hypothetical protein [Gemmata palustris]
MTATLNGKPRKHLADQLDRLDSIIDALAEGLNGAVADACREGTRLAVKDAIVEILTNPELRALLVPQAAPVPAPPPIPAVPPEPKKPGLWTRIKARVAATRAALVGFAAKTKAAVTTKIAAVTGAVSAAGAAAGEALPVRRALTVAIGVGLVVALVCSQVPESASAAVAGIGAACTTVAVQVGAWLKRAARRLGLVT